MSRTDAAALTNRQKDEIFDAGAGLGGRQERLDYAEETAQRLGVSREEILAAMHDEDRARARRKQAQIQQELAMAYLSEHAMDAARTLVEMMLREATTDQQLRMKQAAATELMNRLGMARERDEPKDARIVITGMEPGMPPAHGEQERKGEMNADG